MRIRDAGFSYNWVSQGAKPFTNVFLKNTVERVGTFNEFPMDCRL